ncbi:Single-stranded DNA-binding protein [Nocardia cerradoensis]|uniref:Single-stranded DNA-binding protein n=1 Tax=Nocardia cerradoensis TaxID=85688 RepID=A0A231GUJ8_9NOCA|nr:Single-stranded DNA-binding protein [Nocardia cerradoensis]
MAGDTVLTVTGNLTDSPELRFTPAGAAVANFTVASTPRYFDRTAGEWKDGDPLFLRCNLWRQAAENLAESLVMWISKMKTHIYQHISGMGMSMSRTVDAVSFPLG